MSTSRIAGGILAPVQAPRKHGRTRTRTRTRSHS
jgi:hypothetical protein